jgi:hypothetical protein
MKAKSKSKSKLPVKETAAQTERRNFGAEKKEVIEDNISKTGEFFQKNVLYKYKDGHSCRVMYSEDKTPCVERIMLN